MHGPLWICKEKLLRWVESFLPRRVLAAKIIRGEKRWSGKDIHPEDLTVYVENAKTYRRRVQRRKEGF